MTPGFKNFLIIILQILIGLVVLAIGIQPVDVLLRGQSM
jgi:hypothetical protein